MESRDMGSSGVSGLEWHSVMEPLLASEEDEKYRLDQELLEEELDDECREFCRNTQTSARQPSQTGVFARLGDQISALLKTSVGGRRRRHELEKKERLDCELLEEDMDEEWRQSFRRKCASRDTIPQSLSPSSQTPSYSVDESFKQRERPVKRKAPLVTDDREAKRRCLSAHAPCLVTTTASPWSPEDFLERRPRPRADSYPELVFARVARRGAELDHTYSLHPLLDNAYDRKIVMQKMQKERKQKQKKRRRGGRKVRLAVWNRPVPYRKLRL